MIDEQVHFANGSEKEALIKELEDKIFEFEKRMSLLENSMSLIEKEWDIARQEFVYRKNTGILRFLGLMKKIKIEDVTLEMVYPSGHSFDFLAPSSIPHYDIHYECKVQLNTLNRKRNLAFDLITSLEKWSRISIPLLDLRFLEIL